MLPDVEQASLASIVMIIGSKWWQNMIDPTGLPSEARATTATDCKNIHPASLDNLNNNHCEAGARTASDRKNIHPPHSIILIITILFLTLILLNVLIILYSSPIFIQSTCQISFASRVENYVDPDQLASQKPADIDLHCFQKTGYIEGGGGVQQFARQGLTLIMLDIFYIIKLLPNFYPSTARNSVISIMFTSMVENSVDHDQLAFHFVKKGKQIHTNMS